MCPILSFTLVSIFFHVLLLRFRVFQYKPHLFVPLQLYNLFMHNDYFLPFGERMIFPLGILGQILWQFTKAFIYYACPLSAKLSRKETQGT